MGKRKIKIKTSLPVSSIFQFQYKVTVLEKPRKVIRGTSGIRRKHSYYCSSKSVGSDIRESKTCGKCNILSAIMRSHISIALRLEFAPFCMCVCVGVSICI
jgi:hypothetical protein